MVFTRENRNFNILMMLIGTIVGSTVPFFSIFIDLYNGIVETLSIGQLIYYPNIALIVLPITFSYITIRGSHSFRALFNKELPLGLMQIIAMILKEFRWIFLIEIAIVAGTWFVETFRFDLPVDVTSIQYIHRDYHLFLADSIPVLTFLYAFGIYLLFNAYPFYFFKIDRYRAGFIVAFTAISVVFAFALTLISWYVECYKANLSMGIDNLVLVHKNTKLLWVLDMFPLMTAGFSLLTGLLINNYIGKLQSTVKGQLKSINKVRSFAEKIGQGELDVEYDTTDEKDSMGAALTRMRDNLRASAKKEYDRQWSIEGIAKLSEILRTYTDLNEVAYRVTMFLVNKIDAVQGAFYILEEDKQKKATIRMIASYAYNRKKHLHKEFKIGEGLVGQAAFEREFIYRKELPEDYMTITSGILGDKKPTDLLIVPLISNDTLYGIIELASIHTMEELKINFVKEISEVIGQAVFNLQVNEKTAKLLEEVNNSQKRMQVLLENASEIITIYEKDQRIRYVSPSIQKILGYSTTEMTGNKASKFIHPKGVNDFESMFTELLQNTQQTIQRQFSYFGKDGNRIWMEATGKNLLADPAIQGIVVNTRDITMKRKAEKEEKKRGQMQALSENSPDLIMRLYTDGSFFYINPTIERFTGKGPDAYLQKKMEETDLPSDFIALLHNIIRLVSDTKEKQAYETDFHTPGHKMIISLSAIPEFGDKGEVDTVLLVAHDITEAKMAEHEIQEKNKKITESINYAFRIQRSIMPTAKIIYELFPTSFMLYKPKDIVSGDFPYIYIKDDYIYIATVDCTGHGVPGALMTFIGYFILNQVLSSPDVLDTGKVLDGLHVGVRTTLKQDTAESDARDGMDVALCRINIKNSELQFSGAHRPLLYIKNKKLEEYKADKYPIGGMHYKTRQPFVTHTIKFEPGDSIYFFTDGLPDQFNPEGKKYMSKHVKEIIESNQHLSMEDLHHHIDRDFENWKGTHKQMDDVLLIGIRF